MISDIADKIQYFQEKWPYSSRDQIYRKNIFYSKNWWSDYQTALFWSEKVYQKLQSWD